MRELTRRWLENTQGLIEVSEGERLAELAARVPATHAIVEVGSHTGLSACWMAAGSRDGNGAHITCIDPWGDPRPGSLDDPWELGADGVLNRFLTNVAGTTQEVRNEDYGDLITPLRATSLDIAARWVQPIGLLFVDAIHEGWAVAEDFGAWQRYLASGGWMAFHDYGDSYPGVRDAIKTVVEPARPWLTIQVVGSLWTGRVA